MPLCVLRRNIQVGRSLLFFSATARGVRVVAAIGLSTSCNCLYCACLYL